MILEHFYHIGTIIYEINISFYNIVITLAQYNIH